MIEFFIMYIVKGDVYLGKRKFLKGMNNKMYLCELKGKYFMLGLYVMLKMLVINKLVVLLYEY